MIARLRIWLYNWVFAYWMIFGMKVLGYKFVLPYVPKDDIIAITFSTRQDYVDKICNAIDGFYPKWEKS